MQDLDLYWLEQRACMDSTEGIEAQYSPVFGQDSSASRILHMIILQTTTY
jgi:hypothetical protein